MADLILKVAPEEVRTKAQQIEAQKNQMQSLMNEMQQKVNLLADYWKSQSGQDYTGKYANVTKNINASLETLLTHINNLRDAANRYEQLESDVSKISQNLSTNNVF